MWWRGRRPRMCKRSGFSGLAVVLFLSVLAAHVGAESRTVRVSEARTAQELVQRGGNVVADYGGFQLIQSEASVEELRALGAVVEPEGIELNTARINPQAISGRTMAKSLGKFNGRKLHLVQFAGPIKPSWRTLLEESGARILSYVPQNTYLIYADAPALGRIESWAAVSKMVRWEGEFADDFKLQPGTRLTDGNGFPETPAGDTFAIQLVEDAAVNANTLALIEQLKLEPVRREFRVLQFRNVIVRLPVERLGEIAAQPDVVSIQPYVDPAKRDERQAQIIAGNLTGAAPSAPGYLAWLASKGFTQEQFTASAFVVDVSDSGIDNGTTQPGHPGLYRGGEVGQGSRVAYNRVEGTPHVGSTTEGADGHGNLNAHIVAGFNNDFGGFPHADPQGFRYGLGICPFVKVGASVVFDPDLFTNPNYADLQSKAYQDGARISANSWGMSNNTYTVDAQAFDALVRDAQPEGAAVSAPGNQEMVILFAAGNRGAGFNTVGAPGTAKNVITVGATENVRSLNTANGGNSAMGSDGCGYNDASADGAFDLATFSSRGPCSDGRQKPDLVAPGTHITGGVAQYVANSNGNGFALPGFKASSICALNGGGFVGSAYNFFPLGQQFYTVASGTSHATPAVAGAAALLRQKFINHELPVPSPAMTKAFLMNTARYLTGAGANDHLWSPGQGMGETDLGRAFDGVERVLRDQLPEDLFTASGQTRVFTGRIADTNQPLRVTLAWTDAPGSTVGNAFNNDLDLTVTIGGQTYLGNIFNGAFSMAGGRADARNNVESVFLPAGASGEVVVTVTAANINSDGVPNVGTSLDQDFALVIYNAAATRVPVISAAASAVVAESCFPANGAPDDGETISLSVALRNTGTAATTNLIVTLLATNGVSPSVAVQDYGAMTTDGATVTRVFTFQAGGACGGSIQPVFALSEGGNDVGTVTLKLPIGLTTIRTTTFTNAAAVTLPDNGPATPYPSVIAVAGLTGNVTRVTATLRGYSHGWPDDVDVLLVGPGGQRVLLMSDCGGGNAREGVTVSFDDNASASLPDTAAILPGIYKPTNFDTSTDKLPFPAPGLPFSPTLATFNGQDPNGDWSLYVHDDGSWDAGSLLEGWALSITTSNLTCCDGTGQLADLVAIGTVTPTNVPVGSNVTITVTIFNQGPDPAAFVTVTNLLPSGLSFVSANVSQGVCSQQGGSVVSALGMLNPGAVATLTIETIGATEGTFTNQLAAHSLTPDLQLLNNASSSCLTISNAFIVVDPGDGGQTTNQPPHLLDLADWVVHAGSLVVVTNQVVGTNQSVSFSLATGAPAAAFIHPTSGLLTWRTTDTDAYTITTITVQATDPGPPAWADAKTFLVTVVARPTIAGLVVHEGTVTLAWNSLIGQAYRLERSTNFPAVVWRPASPDILATETVTAYTNAFDPAVSQVYRVLVLP